ncbi:hypothetical protein [Sinorhizobium fredii]|nr:hypothetical protein [Sinorhizobium fredii]
MVAVGSGLGTLQVGDRTARVPLDVVLDAQVEHPRVEVGCAVDDR